MFVNGHIFLVATPFNIKFSSIINMQGHGATEPEDGLKTIISEFTARKINIEKNGDNKFEEVCELLIPDT